MSTLQLVHLVLVSVWAGVILAEVVVELLGRDEASWRTVARIHYWIDLCVEIPLVTAVIATGALLIIPLWPPSPLLMLKVGLGLSAILLNLTCAGLVVRRQRNAADGEALVRVSRQIRVTIIGLPLGIAAFYLGVRYFLW